MKTIRKFSKAGCGLLMVLALFQSCAVYHKTPITMEQAVKENAKTKVLFKDGRIEKFVFISAEEQKYYGTRMTGDGLVKISIDENSVQEVRLKNKTASILVTVIPLAALTALSIAAANSVPSFTSF